MSTTTSGFTTSSTSSPSSNSSPASELSFVPQPSVETTITPDEYLLKDINVAPPEFHPSDNVAPTPSPHPVAPNNVPAIPVVSALPSTTSIPIDPPIEVSDTERPDYSPAIPVLSVHRSNRVRSRPISLLQSRPSSSRRPAVRRQVISPPVASIPDATPNILLSSKIPTAAADPIAATIEVPPVATPVASEIPPIAAPTAPP